MRTRVANPLIGLMGLIALVFPGHKAAVEADQDRHPGNRQRLQRGQVTAKQLPVRGPLIDIQLAIVEVLVPPVLNVAPRTDDPVLRAFCCPEYSRGRFVDRLRRKCGGSRFRTRISSDRELRSNKRILPANRARSNDEGESRSCDRESDPAEEFG